MYHTYTHSPFPYAHLFPLVPTQRKVLFYLLTFIFLKVYIDNPRRFQIGILDCKKYTHLLKLKEWTQRHVDYSGSDTLTTTRVPDEQRPQKLLQ
jgi:hypothetical protein